MNCIAYCKPDMYFNHLFRFIIRYDFEELSIPIPSKDILERLYIEAALKILNERCSIMLSEDETIYSLEWRTPHKNYSEYIEGYKISIFNYINYKLDIYPIIGLEETDNAFSNEKSDMFCQNVIYASFLIAYNRIHDEITNNSFLGAEIVPFGEREILNIYLTPYGMINFDKLYSCTKDERLLQFNSFVESIGLHRVYDKSRLNALSTAIILEKGGRSYYHFKPPSEDYSNNFIMEKLHKPHLSSILIETQASYEMDKLHSIIKEDNEYSAAHFSVANSTTNDSDLQKIYVKFNALGLNIKIPVIKFDETTYNFLIPRPIPAQSLHFGSNHAMNIAKEEFIEDIWTQMPNSLNGDFEEIAFESLYQIMVKHIKKHNRILPSDLESYIGQNILLFNAIRKAQGNDVLSQSQQEEIFSKFNHMAFSILTEELKNIYRNYLLRKS